MRPDQAKDSTVPGKAFLFFLPSANHGTGLTAGHRCPFALDVYEEAESGFALFHHKPLDAANITW
jgi:hypothetical protein